MKEYAQLGRPWDVCESIFDKDSATNIATGEALLPPSLQATSYIDS